VLSWHRCAKRTCHNPSYLLVYFSTFFPSLLYVGCPYIRILTCFFCFSLVFCLQHLLSRKPKEMLLVVQTHMIRSNAKRGLQRTLIHLPRWRRWNFQTLINPLTANTLGIVANWGHRRRVFIRESSGLCCCFSISFSSNVLLFLCLMLYYSFQFVTNFTEFCNFISFCCCFLSPFLAMYSYSSA
jgi:hypothetical protein